MNKINKNNKGFTLVELIVVIAVISIISIVIAPKLLTYVEKARKGTDENAIWEVAHAAEVAYASVGKEEGINELLVRIHPTAGTATYAPPSFSFVETIDKTISETDYVYKSKTFKGNTFTITVDEITGKATVSPGEPNSSLGSQLEQTVIVDSWLTGKITAKDVVEEAVQLITGGRLSWTGSIKGGYELTETDWEKIDEVAFELGATSDVLYQKAEAGETEFFINLLDKAGINYK